MRRSFIFLLLALAPWGLSVVLPARAQSQGLESFLVSLSCDSGGAREGAIEVGLSFGRVGLSSRTAFSPAGFARESIGLDLKDSQLDLSLAADFDLAGLITGRLSARLGRELIGSAEFDLGGLKSGRLAFNFNASGLKFQGELAFAPGGLTALEAKARYHYRVLGLDLATTTAFDLRGLSRQEFEASLPLGPLELTSATAFNRQGFSEERLSLGVQEARLLGVDASLSGTLALTFGPTGYSGAALEAELRDPLFRGFYLDGLLEFDRAGLGSALLIVDYVSNGLSLSGSVAWEESGLSSGQITLFGLIAQAKLGGTLLFGPEGLDSTELALGLPLGAVYLSSATTIELGRGGLWWQEKLVARALLRP